VSEVKSNVSYGCKKCGVEGTFVENVESINLNEVKLPYDCSAMPQILTLKYEEKTIAGLGLVEYDMATEIPILDGRLTALIPMVVMTLQIYVRYNGKTVLTKRQDG